MWQAKTHAMGRLREVANRLHAPEKSMAFSHWFKDWQAAKEAALKAESRKKGKQLNEQTALIASLQAELHEARAVLQKAGLKRDDGRIDQTEVQRIREEMEAKAREERIELLRRQVGRRMMNKDLSEAWTAWFEMWSAKTYAMGRLREIANRLRAPEKSMAFSHWQRDWQEYLKHQQIRAWKQREDALEGTTAALEQELKALRVEYEGKLRQAEEAKHLALERQLISLTGTAEERKAAVEEQALERGGVMERAADELRVVRLERRPLAAVEDGGDEGGGGGVRSGRGRRERRCGEHMHTCRGLMDAAEGDEDGRITGLAVPVGSLAAVPVESAFEEPQLASLWVGVRGAP
jgi:hypothetical protein